jgi:hypothetical protein
VSVPDQAGAQHSQSPINAEYCAVIRVNKFVADKFPWLSPCAAQREFAFRGSYHNCCHHNASLRLADLPDWDWRDISAHLRCTKCGTVGYVDTRLNWSEVINFNKGVG